MHEMPVLSRVAQQLLGATPKLLDYFQRGSRERQRGCLTCPNLHRVQIVLGNRLFAHRRC